MRTKADIVKWLDQHQDMLGFRIEAVGHYVYEQLATEKFGMDRSKWPEELKDVKDTPLTEDAVISEIRGYMEFAFDKALGHRGISASRSVEKVSAWLFVLEDPLYEFAVTPSNYANYGVPVLKRVAKRFDIKLPERIEGWPDGGPCRPDCEAGCGR